VDPEIREAQRLFNQIVHEDLRAEMLANPGGAGDNLHAAEGTMAQLRRTISLSSPYAILRLDYPAGAGLWVSPASTEPSRPCGRKMMNNTSKVP
jgi:hypothetical protein